MDLPTLQAYAKQVLKKAEIISAIHENNRYLSFSEELHSKIPKSYAAYAVMILQSSMREQELLKLCSIWEDKKDPELYSIPRILRPFNPQSVHYKKITTDLVNFVVSERQKAQRNSPYALRKFTVCPNDPEFISSCRNDALNSVRILSYLYMKSKIISGNKRVKHIRNFRNKHVSHYVRRTHLEIKGETVPNPKYNDVDWLYFKTITMAEEAHDHITQINTPLRKSLRRQNYKNATELWTNFELNLNR